MFGIGGFELFIILIFGFLIFGPEKLPEIAKTVGRGIARFREAQQEMSEVVNANDFYDPNNPEEPFKDPVEALDKLARHQEEKRAKAEAEKAENQAKSASGETDEKAVSDDDSVVVAEGATDEAPARAESFTERKARYERERAARKAAEAVEAQAQEQTEAVTKAVVETEAGAIGDSSAKTEEAQAQSDAKEQEIDVEGGDA